MGKRENIDECREIAQRHNSQGVVIMRIEADGVITVSTYGKDKHRCDILGEWADKQINAQLPRIPFEPAFGWGNNGEPKALEMREYMALPPAHKAYYDRCLPPHLKVSAD